jgi:putative flavoprotein involved in K+ transport
MFAHHIGLLYDGRTCENRQENRMNDVEIIVVGGGAAGLSAAGALVRQGRAPLVIERAHHIGAVWEARYDRLHLHTVFSSLAHYALPKTAPRYPSKDDYASYLRDYARHFGLGVVAGCTVRQVRPASPPDQGWVVVSDCGVWRCRVVVLAVGQYGVPVVPDWTGRAGYGGVFIHSSAYRNPQSFVGCRVVVVGAGNSGAEIATDLAAGGAAWVGISIRSPPPVVPRDPFGMPVQRTGILMSMVPPALADRLARLVARLTLGDLTRYGLAPAAWAPYRDRRVPLIDVGFVAALKRGDVQIRPAVIGLTDTGVYYQDGRAEVCDAIIAATGFRSPLPGLLDAPGALDDAGEPRFRSGAPTNYPGLYFIGYTHSLRGHLFEANRDSRRLAREITTYLRQPRTASATPR